VKTRLVLFLSILALALGGGSAMAYADSPADLGGNGTSQSNDAGTAAGSENGNHTGQVNDQTQAGSNGSSTGDASGNEAEQTQIGANVNPTDQDADAPDGATDGADSRPPER